MDGMLSTGTYAWHNRSQHRPRPPGGERSRCVGGLTPHRQGCSRDTQYAAVTLTPENANVAFNRT